MYTYIYIKTMEITWLTDFKSASLGKFVIQVLLPKAD